MEQRLIDEVRASGTFEDEDFKRLWGDLTIIDGTNVCEYYWAQEKEDWCAADFPFLAPPFSAYWIEFSVPTNRDKEDSLQQIIFDEFGVEKWGFIAMPIEFHSKEQYQRFLSMHLAMGGWGRYQHLFAQLDDVKWLQQTVMCVKSKQEGIIDDYAIFLTAIREDGSVCYTVDDEGTRHYAQAVIPGPSLEMFALTAIGILGVDEERMALYTHILLTPLYNCFLLTISFLHCKNIKLENNTPARPHNKAQKRKLKKREYPLVSYKTLNLYPMKQVLSNARESDGSAPTGLKRRLHIVRGHFRNYQDKPLFGKVTGRFWIPQHTAGSAPESIEKDYRVNTKHIKKGDN